MQSIATRTLHRHFPTLLPHIHRIPYHLGPQITNHVEFFQKIGQIAYYALELTAVVFFRLAFPEVGLVPLAALFAFSLILINIIAPRRTKENHWLHDYILTKSCSLHHIENRNRMHKKIILCCLRIQTFMLACFGHPLLAFALSIPYLRLLDGIQKQQTLLQQPSLYREVNNTVQGYMGKKIYDSSKKPVIFSEEELGSYDLEFISSKNYLRLALLSLFEKISTSSLQNLLQKIPADKQQINENMNEGESKYHHPWLILRKNLQETNTNPEEILTELHQLWKNPSWIDEGEQKKIPDEQIDSFHTYIRQSYDPCAYMQKKIPLSPKAEKAAQSFQRQMDTFVYVFSQKNVLYSAKKELCFQKEKKIEGLPLHRKIGNFFRKKGKDFFLTLKTTDMLIPQDEEDEVLPS